MSRKPTAYELRAAQEVRDFVNQQILPDTPARTVPDARLKAKRRQSEKLTLLELFQGEIEQRKLFD